MKKFILLSLTALLSVSVFLTGCPTDAETKTVTVSQLEIVDNWATDANDLRELLEDPDSGVIGVKAAIADLGSPTTVSSGRKVILYASVTTGAGELIINGEVVVGNGGILVATDAGHPVVLKGTLEVRDGGTLTLTAGTILSVVNDATPPATALGSVKYSGGSLVYGVATEVDTPAKIGAVLSNYINGNGTLDLSGLVLTGLKIRDLAGVTGISATRRLKADAAVAEDGSAALPIPAGAYIKGVAGETLAAPASITVAGTLDLGVNTALNLTNAITTTGTGKIVSATVTPASLKSLLDKAGTALNIEQTAAVTLGAANEVKAGTVLTLKSGALTADNDAAKKLAVAGTVVLDGGTLAIGTTTTDGTNPAITITGSGRIEAGDVVISGAGTLYDATGTNAKAITITKAAGFVGSVEGLITLKGATTINAGEGKVVLSVDGGGASDTGTFTSAAANGQLTVTGDAIALDNGTAVGAALTISAKGKLAVGSGGIIKIKGADSTLVSGADTAKLSINAAAKLELNGVATGTTATFTTTTGAFANTGTFASGSGDYKGATGFWAAL